MGRRTLGAAASETSFANLKLIAHQGRGCLDGQNATTVSMTRPGALTPARIPTADATFWFLT
ncbi:MAG: hypothetical protein J2P54_02505, partial [Bradyrhizobiaceae bacterium]|nr:hypothetical protein [Bradyrhizobiaceae bacterium]